MITNKFRDTDRLRVCTIGRAEQHSSTEQNSRAPALPLRTAHWRSLTALSHSSVCLNLALQTQPWTEQRTSILLFYNLPDLPTKSICLSTSVARGFIASRSIHGREAAYPLSGNIFLSSVMTALWFHWENSWKVLLQNQLSFQIFLRLRARERGTILWSISWIKLRSEKWDVIPWEQMDFFPLDSSYRMLTWHALCFFSRQGPQHGSHSCCVQSCAFSVWHCLLGHAPS